MRPEANRARLVDRHSPPGIAVSRARLSPDDHGDPLSRYKRVDLESTGIDCGNNATRPWSCVMATKGHLTGCQKQFMVTLLTYSLNVSMFNGRLERTGPQSG
jgi:hypothetical protein